MKNFIQELKEELNFKNELKVIWDYLCVIYLSYASFLLAHVGYMDLSALSAYLIFSYHISISSEYKF